MAMTPEERFYAVLRGETPDCIPWIDRLEIWYHARRKQGILPPDYADLSLAEVHRKVGLAQQRFVPCVQPVWSDVEIVGRRNGEEYFRSDAFPIVIPFYYGLFPEDTPGEYTIEITTPRGRVDFGFRITEKTIADHSMPFMHRRPIRCDDDYAAVEYIIEHIRFEPNFEAWQDVQTQMEGQGIAIGLVDRVPFQRLLLEFLGEERTIYQLADNRRRVERLLKVFGERHLEQVEIACRGPLPYIESGDNIDGQFTSPPVFERYCLPHFQRVTDLVHRHSKFYGSHLDGEMKPLLALVPETGLDVAESVTPAPLTRLSIFDLLDAWPDRPIIWGGVPSTIFEPGTPQAEFEEAVQSLVARLVPDRRAILGIGDQAIGPSLIERVHYISQYLETFGWYPIIHRDQEDRG